MLSFLMISVSLFLEQILGRNALISFLKGFSFGLLFHGLGYYTDYFVFTKPLK
jgi:hypothetical protein